MQEDRQRRRRREFTVAGRPGSSGGMLCLLFFVVSSSEAFLSGSTPSLTYRTTRNLRATVAPSQEQSSSFSSLEDFNAQLEQIAQKCSSFKEPVIARAAECQQLWEKGQEGDESSFVPDISSFQTMLSAWNRCTQTLAKSRRENFELPPDDSGMVVDVYTPLDAAKRATSLLLAHPEPSLTSYNIIMDAWSKSRVPEAPDATERLIKRMMEDEEIEPDTTSFNLLLDAWANSNRENSLEKVTQIYKHMENLHEEGNTHVSPTIRTINAVLHAHAKKAAQFTKQSNREGYEEAAKCAQAAYEILQEAKRRYEETQDPEWQPDVATYTSCIDVHSRCGSYETATKADEMLNELRDLYDESNSYKYKVNFRTYTSVITAWSRTRSDESPKRVEALMAEMEKDPATKPNAKTYTAAIQCWARSRDHDKAKHVLKLLMDMREQHKTTGRADFRPTTMTYNHAIDACARCQGSEQQKTEALKIAFAVLKTIEMDEACSPDAGTYSTLIRALSFLMPSGDARNTVTQPVFEKAKKAGLIDFTTVMNLRRCVDAETFAKALEGKVDRNGSFDYSELPLAWSRNT
jgi:pentatricopeptide repeat protein